MSILRITNGFSRLSDENLLGRTGQINIAMGGNGNFPTPTPTLAQLQTALTDFEIALAKAKTGSELEKAIKNDKREALVNLLHSLSNYVLFTADGSETVAKSSGFSIARPPEPAPELTPATNQVLEDGQNAGELKFSFDKVPTARSYMYQYTVDPVTDNSVWQGQPGTTRKTVFTGLQSGKKYWCRVYALGTRGQGVYSEPVSRIVQ
jgi:hypothetical protein